jgi:phenylpyruvate tautomerase PptA (4-oxalocrotonate tautomerase family)
MPVYTLACNNFLNTSTSQRIAEAITNVHIETTGAPAEFVSVVFMYGQPLKPNIRMSVNGNVRSGGNRNKELTEDLKRKLLKAMADASALAESQIEVNLLGFPASWVMEGGEILPEPGQEHGWLKRKANTAG